MVKFQDKLKSITRGNTIIGEVAKNILNQSSDKITQIQKYVDLILINKILKEKGEENVIKNMELGFKTLNLNFQNEKVLMIISDGSYFELLNANKKEYNINNKLTGRELKNYQNYQKIISLLEESNIPFIIFFIPSKLEDFLLKYKEIKNIKSWNKNFENDKKMIQLRENFYFSYYLYSIYLDMIKFKSDILEKIMILYQPYNIYYISNMLYKEIIQKIKIKKEINLELIFYNEKENIPSNINNFFEGFLLSYNYINFKSYIKKNKEDFDKYLNENKNKKISIDYYRILMYDITKNDVILNSLTNKDSMSFSFLITQQDFDNNLDNLKDNLINFISSFFKFKFINVINNNYIYYDNDKEYLTRKNLKTKIKHDLAKLNYKIIFTNDDKNEFQNKELNEAFNSIIESLKKNQLSAIAINLYNELDKGKQSILNLKEENFSYFDIYRTELFEHFLCWEIYRNFFCEFLPKQLIMSAKN